MKKIVLIVFIALSSFIGIVPKLALAQTGTPTPTSVPSTGTWYNQSFPEFFTKVYDPNYSTPNEIFGERYTAAQVQWVIYSLFSFIVTGGQTGNAEIIACAMSGDAGSCMKGAIENFKKLLPPELISQSTQNKSFLATITSNPISGVGYISNLSSKFHIVPEVHAQQGFGYSQAGFVLNLWKISRNISYAFMVIAVIVMSFMIMFRVKISPQVVITIQSALPKIIFALILITFSYAIAGFLIDFMYVVIGLLSTILTTTWGAGLKLSGWDWQHMFTQLTQADMFWVLTLYLLSFIVTDFALIGSAGIIYALLGIIFAVIMIFLLVFYSLKILIMMFKTFLNIVVLIITAPFSIMAGTIIQGAGFGPWLRSMVSNLLVYPVVGAMVFFANFFLAIAGSATLGGSSAPMPWLYYLNPLVTPDLLTSSAWWDPPLTNGIAAGNGLGIRGILMLAASWTIVSMIPKTVEVVKSMMQGKEFAGGTAMGEASSTFQGFVSPFTHSKDPRVATTASIIQGVLSALR